MDNNEQNNEFNLLNENNSESEKNNNQNQNDTPTPTTSQETKTDTIINSIGENKYICIYY